MFSICFKPKYTCSCFKLFILVGLQQTMGLPSLMTILQTIGMGLINKLALEVIARVV